MDTAIGAKTLDHPFWETLLLAGLYGLAYMGLFLLSDKIIGLAGFSLWFPAAGIRFALIFVYGWRFGLLAASVEILAQGLLGEWTSWHYDPVFIVAGIGAPPLIYAAVIWVLNRYQLTHAAFSKFSHVIWICIAVVLAPALTAPVSTGLQVYGHRMAAGAFQEATLSFWVGDMVGLLMIAPIAMLSIAAFREKTTKFFKNVQNFVFLLEYAAALLFIWMTFQYTQGTLPSLRWLPLVLPMLAISLRFGFAGAGLIILSLNIMVPVSYTHLTLPT
ncbi:MAG: MASE1 domain-containing protein, partial [Kordiimonadaceae bacterium]|nr:MASE1 domain-containing protein [Kordiimonadaceae bacterium]